MRLISCHIEHFGKLTDKDFRFEPDLHVICSPNGWGKTTLASFVRVMFYGFAGEGRRSSTGNERQFYRPWGGGVYGGSLTFSDGRAAYTIYRTFSDRRKEDTFRILNAETGLDTDDYSSDIGEELFGIDSVSFQKSVFCGQPDLDTQITAPIRAKIGGLDDEQDDMRAYDDAQAQLRKISDKLSPDRANGLIRKHRESLSAMSAQLAALPSLRAKERSLAEQYVRLSKEARTPSADEVDRDRSLRALRSLRQREQVLTRRGRELAVRRRSLAEALQARESQRKELLHTIQLCRLAMFWCLFFCLAAAFLVLGDFVPRVWMWMLLPLSAAILLSVLLMSRARSRLPDPDETAAIADRREHCTQRIRSLSAQIRRLRWQMEEYSALSLKEQVRPGAADLQRIRAELEDVRGALRELEETGQACEHLRDSLAREERQRQICLDTARILKDARDSFTARYMPPFTRAFNRYYGMIAGEAAKPVRTDAALSVSVLEAGSPRDPEQLSTGALDLIRLCRRLAMADAMYPVQKPFLIMDDPFVHLDDERIKGGLQLLRSASRDYQILYLTCHESRCP